MKKKRIAILMASILLSAPLRAEAQEQSICTLSGEIDGWACYYAHEYGLPEALIEALIECESSGNPFARNGKCQGLMQVNIDDFTARGYTDVWDIQQNIKCGCEILIDKRELAGWDLVDALGFYNGQSSPRYAGYVEKVLKRAAELEASYYEY